MCDMSSNPLAVSALACCAHYAGGLPGGSQLQRRVAGTQLRCLKIGYPCCLRFIRDESYTVDLFFSTKSRLGGISGVEPQLQGGTLVLALLRGK